jgi:hypothetical protein
MGRTLPPLLQHKAALESLYSLDAEMEEQGWDQPARLYAVTLSTEGFDLGGDLTAFALSLHRAPLGLLEDENPADWLPYLADRFARLVFVAREDMFGWLLVVEGWMVHGDVRDQERTERIVRAAEENQLGRLDERVQTRSLMLQTTEHQVSLVHERDGIVRERSTYPINDYIKLAPSGGRVWDGLRYLTKATLQPEA